MLPLGYAMPSFDLPLLQINDNTLFSSSNTAARFTSNMLLNKPVLIMILCAHCPFVKNIESELSKLDQDFGDDIQFLAVASNSVESHPEDGPEFLVQQIIKNGWNFPYLLDLEQTFAKSLKAACTPDFFLFSYPNKGSHHLIYRGQLDESRPGNNIDPNGFDLRRALNAVLNSCEVPIDQKPSIGCNIKWREGFEPSWFG
ncbi:hypothetical protein EV11_0069 [Prochlorococcus sp. SS52]|nr:thioredoxin family protein [Prochlorococcus marinus]KGG37511.1 hypothetical protein EV11_0069 [Prochlorococcus sp. SS52]